MTIDPSAELTAAINRLAAALERQNAGACPSYIETTILDTEERFHCRYPAAHIGLHANDPAIDEHNTTTLWHSDNPEARTIGPTKDTPSSQCGAVRTEWYPSNVEAYGPASDWPCDLSEGHGGRHQDRDGDDWI